MGIVRISTWKCPTGFCQTGLSVVEDLARKSLAEVLSIRYEFDGFVQQPCLGRLTNLVPKADTHAFCPCISHQLTPCGVEGLLAKSLTVESLFRVPRRLLLADFAASLITPRHLQKVPPVSPEAPEVRCAADCIMLRAPTSVVGR